MHGQQGAPSTSFEPSPAYYVNLTQDLQLSSPPHSSTTIRIGRQTLDQRDLVPELPFTHYAHSRDLWHLVLKVDYVLRSTAWFQATVSSISLQPAAIRRR